MLDGLILLVGNVFIFLYISLLIALILLFHQCLRKQSVRAPDTSVSICVSALFVFMFWFAAGDLCRTSRSIDWTEILIHQEQQKKITRCCSPAWLALSIKKSSRALWPIPLHKEFRQRRRRKKFKHNNYNLRCDDWIHSTVRGGMQRQMT